MQLKLTLLFLPVFIGCASRTITVLDENEKPVSEALVVAQGTSFLSSKLSIGLTDPDGKLTLVGQSVTILKPGYHPIIAGAGMTAEPLAPANGSTLWWMPSFLDGPVMRLYPIREPNTARIRAQLIVLAEDPATPEKRITLSACPGVDVFYNSQREELTVRSNERNLTESENLFFAKAPADKVKEIRGRQRVSFYCKVHNQVDKVGIIRSAGRIAVPNVWQDVFKVLEAPNINYETRLEPAPICPTTENTHTYSLRAMSVKNRPAVSRSTQLREAIKQLKEKLPCGSDSIKWLESVESAL